MAAIPVLACILIMCNRSNNDDFLPYTLISCFFQCAVIHFLAFEMYEPCLIISGPYSVFVVISINSFIQLEVWLSIWKPPNESLSYFR